jgi:serine protease Do
VKATSGLVVVDVRSSSRAADAGIRPGDVIEEIDRRRVDSGEALREALANGKGPALVLVHRGDASLYLTLERHTP